MSTHTQSSLSGDVLATSLCDVSPTIKLELRKISVV